MAFSTGIDPYKPLRLSTLQQACRKPACKLRLFVVTVPSLCTANGIGPVAVGLEMSCYEQIQCLSHVTISPISLRSRQNIPDAWLLLYPWLQHVPPRT